MQTNKTKKFLNAELIYKYLTCDDETLDTKIMCNAGQDYLFTFDQSLYEALGSVKDRHDINMNKLVKLLEVIEVLPYRTVMKSKRTVLTQERADDISRRIKIGGNENE